ncbi:MAG: 6-phosphogluconolactonase [Sulfuricellaceae bacterium]|nr:6-phosphogluconolactonase [Sulfuricellaceae bacterium]
MNKEQRLTWHVVGDAALLQARAARAIERLAAETIRAKGSFSIVLAGGSTPKEIYGRLCSIDTDWSAWSIFLGDERCLPHGHPDRNSTMAQQTWLSHVPLAADQVHLIPAEQGAEEAASRYSKTLAGVGSFDLVLLGLGQDGHTASLFPGQAWGEGGGMAALAVHDAPKPPSDRVSLSAWRLSMARNVWFMVSGADKADAVHSWRSGECLPAAAIKPENGVEIFVEKIAIKNHF